MSITLDKNSSIDIAIEPGKTKEHMFTWTHFELSKLSNETFTTIENLINCFNAEVQRPLGTEKSDTTCTLKFNDQSITTNQRRAINFALSIKKASYENKNFAL